MSRLRPTYSPVWPGGELGPSWGHFDPLCRRRVSWAVAAPMRAAHPPCAGERSEPPSGPGLKTTEDERRSMTVRTYSPKPGDVQRQWHVIDANDVVLGRLAVQAATLL